MPANNVEVLADKTNKVLDDEMMAEEMSKYTTGNMTN